MKILRGTTRYLVYACLCVSFCWLVFVKSGCTVSFGGGEKEGVCGNGKIDPGEECDDGNDQGGDGCGSDCLMESGWECAGEPSTCVSIAVCGDGEAEGDESCDGDDLRGETCESVGYGPGILRCDEYCGFLTDDCGPPPGCGNGVVDDGEVCDGAELGGVICEDLGYYGGELSCLDDCSDFDTSECEGRCGDGVINEPEECDGDALQGRNCAYFGFYGGELGCLDDCSAFDLSDCWEDPVLLINEVSTGATDWVEVVNISSVGVNTGGWVVAWEGLVADDIETGSFLLPDLMLPPDERLTLIEDPSNSGKSPELVGPRTVQYGWNITWGLAGGGAVIIDPDGRPTDMIRWGGCEREVEGTGWVDTPARLPGYQKAGVSFSRVPDGFDTDAAEDFCFSESTQGQPNLMPCLQPYTPSSVLLTEIKTEPGLLGSEMIELYNNEAETVSLGGWVLVTHRSLGTNFMELPSYELEPGAYAQIICDVGSWGIHHVDEDGVIHIRRLGWGVGGSNYLALREPLVGLGVDFIRWGGDAMEAWDPDVWFYDPEPLVLPDDSLSLGRVDLVDTNTSADWCHQESSPEAPNTDCL